MRHFLITTAALAIGALVVSTAAKAQSYNAGGPTKVGSMCKVATDLNGDMDNYGFYEPCGQQAVASAPRRKR